MAGPGTTSSAKNAPIVKLGHTTDGKNGSDPNIKGRVQPVREISPKG